MERWKGRSALVTGASAGIGYAILEALAKNGMRVIGCARNIGEIQKLRASLPDGSNLITAIHCDVSKEEQVLRMFKEIADKFGYVDILINNAGTAIYEPNMISGNIAGWRTMLELNVLGLSVCTREVLQLMFKSNIDDGHIININSVDGHSMNVSSDEHFYAGTKHMVTALTKALNAELRQKKTKIRITSISPGLVDTPLVRNWGLEDPSKGGQHDYTNMPILDAKDISDAVLYVIAAPPHVNVRELIIAPIGEACY